MIESKPLTIEEFFSLVRVIRMLYGLEVAQHIFEQSLEEFTGYTQKDLQELVATATMRPTR